MKKHLAVAVTVFMLLGTAGLSSAAMDGSAIDFGVKLGYTSPVGDFSDAFDGAFAGGLYLNYPFTPSIIIIGNHNNFTTIF